MRESTNQKSEFDQKFSDDISRQKKEKKKNPHTMQQDNRFPPRLFSICKNIKESTHKCSYKKQSKY